MAWDGTVSALLTILPALGLLMYILRRYEGFFDQGKLVFALTVGLFGGILVRFLEVALFQFEAGNVAQDLGPLYSLMYTAVGYALLHATAMTAVLGLGRFRLRKDSPFHGTALGVAFAGMWLQAALRAHIPTVDGHIVITQSGLVFMAFQLLLALGLVMTFAMVGTTIGRGSAEGSLRRSILYGMLWGAPAMAAYWFFVQAIIPPGIAVLAAVVWGVIAVRQLTKILDRVVPPEIRMQLQRAQRREARRKA